MQLHSCYFFFPSKMANKKSFFNFLLQWALDNSFLKSWTQVVGGNVKATFQTK